MSSAKARARVPTEHAEAVAFASWLQRRGILFAHAPNEAKRSHALAARLRAEGMSPGVPDYLIFSRVPIHPEARGVAIELKRRRPAFRPPTISQRQWLARLEAEGWICYVAQGAQQGIEFLHGLGF